MVLQATPTRARCLVEKYPFPGRMQVLFMLIGPSMVAAKTCKCQGSAKVGYEQIECQCATINEHCMCTVVETETEAHHFHRCQRLVQRLTVRLPDDLPRWAEHIRGHLQTRRTECVNHLQTRTNGFIAMHIES